MFFKNSCNRDSPGDPVVKDLPANAGNMGLIPGPGTKISHTTRQLSPYTTTTEAPILVLRRVSRFQSGRRDVKNKDGLLLK